MVTWWWWHGVLVCWWRRHVKFKYTVSAEKGFDGLSFYIDVEEQPALPLQSSQLEPVEATFPLTEGYHTLTWVYSKDEKWTAGSDTATIRVCHYQGLLSGYYCQGTPLSGYATIRVLLSGYYYQGTPLSGYYYQGRNVDRGQRHHHHQGTPWRLGSPPLCGRLVAASTYCPPCTCSAA